MDLLDGVGLVLVELPLVLRVDAVAILFVLRELVVRQVVFVVLAEISTIFAPDVHGLFACVDAAGAVAEGANRVGALVFLPHYESRRTILRNTYGLLWHGVQGVVLEDMGWTLVHIVERRILLLFLIELNFFILLSLVLPAARSIRIADHCVR